MLPAVLSHGGFSVSGAYDIDAERLKKVSAEYSVPAFETVEGLLEKCDAAYIATTNNSHVPLAIKAIEAGVAVLLEKPLADTLDAALKLQKAVEKANPPLLAGYMYKYNRHNALVKSLVREGRIGKVTAFSGSFGWYYPEPGAWRMKRAFSGAGALGDVGIYIVSTAIGLMGEAPLSCVARAYPAGDAVYGDKYLTGRLNFSGGRWAQMTTSFISDSHEYAAIGTEGVISAENSWAQNGEGCVKLCRGGNMEILRAEIVNPYEEELKVLLACMDGQPVPGEMGIECAVTDMRVMNALEKSAACGGAEIAVNT